MDKHTSPNGAHILPFDEWLEQRFPGKSAKRTMLKMIGALDLAYLLYRMNAKPEPEVKPAPAQKKPVAKKPRIVPAMPEPEQHGHAKHANKASTRRAPVKKENKPAELTIEFHQPAVAMPVLKDDPVKAESAPEPEPLVLKETIEAPAPRMLKPSMTWLDDERLEEEDPRRTDIRLGVDGIAVGFDTRDVDDERETLLTVDGVPFVLTTTSPALNLSAMVQIMRVNYGELYVLGRMALGAISADGYVTAEEAKRIILLLKESTAHAVDIDVEYFAKDKKSRNRTAEKIQIRFERA